MMQGAERQRRKKLKSAAVVGVTCCSAGLPILEGQTFDVVMLDEASQLVEPLSLSPLTCAKPRQDTPIAAVYCTSQVYTELRTSALHAHAVHQRFAPCVVEFCKKPATFIAVDNCNDYTHKKPCCGPLDPTAAGACRNDCC